MADSKENYEWDLGSERVTKLWSDLTSFFFFVTSQLGSYTCNVRGSETPDCCLIHHRSDLKIFFLVLITSQLGSYTCNVRGRKWNSRLLLNSSHDYFLYSLIPTDVNLVMVQRQLERLAVIHAKMWGKPTEGKDGHYQK